MVRMAEPRFLDEAILGRRQAAVNHKPGIRRRFRACFGEQEPVCYAVARSLRPRQPRDGDEDTMIRLRKPSPVAMRRFLQDQARLDFTYAAVGATATVPPSGYTVDRTRVELGKGEEVFRTARAALGRWEHFRLGWVEAWPPDTPIQEGAVVAVRARMFGLWWLNAARVVYVVDRDRPVAAFGFAYGTLPDHAESGEERFVVEWDRRQGGVWYDILAFSRPRHFLARLGYPLTRRLQKRFARDSAAAMRRAVGLPG
jgi:uncharacterized protein (UPF0548 family)